MAIINELKRGVPPYPDPNDKDKERVNRQIIEAVTFLLSIYRQGGIEKRIADLEDMVSKHEDIISG